MLTSDKINNWSPLHKVETTDGQNQQAVVTTTENPNKNFHILLHDILI